MTSRSALVAAQGSVEAGRYRGDILAAYQVLVKLRPSKGTFEVDYLRDLESSRSRVEMIAGEFTGKIVEGVREGKGTLKWANGDEYIGVFKNGLRHGKGVFREKNGRSYEGQWLISQKEGKGREVWPNGDVYVGSYSRDKMNGQGELLTKGGKYTGNFKDSIKEG